MRFKEDAETVYSDNPYYDVIDGGYIDPDKLLISEDAVKVNEAIETLSSFLAEAEENGYLEIQ